MTEDVEDPMEPHMAAEKFENEVPKDDDKENDDKETLSKELRTVDYVTYGFAIACVVFSLLAIASAPGNWRKNIIYAAFIMSIFSSFLVTIQRYFLTKMDTLRDVMNDVRSEALRLQTTNNELTLKNNELEKEVKKVEDIEKQLSDLLGAQGHNVDNFVSLVKENSGLLKEIKEKMKAQTMNDFLTIVLLSDRDENFIIDPNEVSPLIFRLENQAGVKIDKKTLQSSA